MKTKLLIATSSLIFAASLSAKDVAINSTTGDVAFASDTKYIVTGGTKETPLVLNSLTSGSGNLNSTVEFNLQDGTFTEIALAESINFNGFSVTGDGSLTFTQGAGNTAKSIVYASNVSVDGATFNVNLGANTNINYATSSVDTPIMFNVHNNGVLNWNTAIFAAKYYGVNISSGSTMELDTAYDTDVKSFKLSYSILSGQLIIKEGSNAAASNFYVDWYGDSYISNQLADNASKLARFRLQKDAILTISDSEAHSIESTAKGIVMTNSTLNLNSSNAIYFNDGGNKNHRLNIQFTGTTETLSIGADNELGKFEMRNATVSLNLNSKKLALTDIDFTTNATAGKTRTLIISGFQNGNLSVIDGTTIMDDIDMFIANDDSAYDGIYKTFSSDYIKLSDGSDKLVYFVDATGNLKDYLGQVWTMSAANDLIANIPEPAEWAALFGALALGLAVYRRRK